MEKGQIKLEDFKDIGEALSHGKWSEAQNEALYTQIDSNHDEVVIMEAALTSIQTPV